MSLWNIEDTGIPIVFVGPVLGGPWIAMALEEPKVLGLKYAIGIGAYGSFSDRLRLDDTVICDNAVVSDGTSRVFLPVCQQRSLNRGFTVAPTVLLTFPFFLPLNPPRFPLIFSSGFNDFVSDVLKTSDATKQKI